MMPLRKIVLFAPKVKALTKVATKTIPIEPITKLIKIGKMSEKVSWKSKLKKGSMTISGKQLITQCAIYFAHIIISRDSYLCKIRSREPSS